MQASAARGGAFSAIVTGSSSGAFLWIRMSKAKGSVLLRSLTLRVTSTSVLTLTRGAFESGYVESTESAILEASSHSVWPIVRAAWLSPANDRQSASVSSSPHGPKGSIATGPPSRVTCSPTVSTRGSGHNRSVKHVAKLCVRKLAVDVYVTHNSSSSSALTSVFQRNMRSAWSCVTRVSSPGTMSKIVSARDDASAKREA